MSDNVSCDRLACWPVLSGLRRNDHLIVRMWQKREHTHCMLLILMAEGLIPWGLFVGWFRLGLGIGCVVVGVVNMWLLPTPDRIRNLLPGLVIFDPLGPLLRSSWVPVGCCGLTIVALGSVGLA